MDRVGCRSPACFASCDFAPFADLRLCDLPHTLYSHVPYVSWSALNIFLYNVKPLVFVMAVNCVLFEVGTVVLYLM